MHKIQRLAEYAFSIRVDKLLKRITALVCFATIATVCAAVNYGTWELLMGRKPQYSGDQTLKELFLLEKYQERNKDALSEYARLASLLAET